MDDNYRNESLMDIFLFESNHQMEQMEQILLTSEEHGDLSKEAINELFRIMHTLKGSSAMMMIENIALLAHAIEDLFALLRDNQSLSVRSMKVIEIMLECTDFIKAELAKLETGDKNYGNSAELVKQVKDFLAELKSNSKEKNQMVQLDNTKSFEQKEEKCFEDNGNSECIKHLYKALIKFECDCKMENIRAFTIVNNLKDVAYDVSHTPNDIISDESAEEYIRQNGFELFFKSDMEYEDIKSILMQTIFLNNLEFEEISDTKQAEVLNKVNTELEKTETQIKEPIKTDAKNEDITKSNILNSSMISVNVKKLDKLMDLVGELMISGLMVTTNSNLHGPQFDEFKKQANLHQKLIGELQDISMSLRMVPLSATFKKMSRIIRDVSKKLGKEIHLEILGEETEIDKNIVENISDPLMHLVRNAADHGIEDKNERAETKKNMIATVTLQAKNVGGEVWIIVKDDGKGLDMKKIYDKACSKGMVLKGLSEMADEEVYSLIFKPGFSTKEAVTEFSGRGVGLDVVMKNITGIGGSVSVNSSKGNGSTFIIKIPLTLAIIGGMIIKIGEAKYAVPTMSVKECIRSEEKDVIKDPDGNELIMVRGEYFPIIRIHEVFKVETSVKDICEGVLIMVESSNGKYCIFADELVEEQQIVVKPLPEYISKKIKGVSGCTLLGDGSISLIIDLESLAA